MFNFIIATNKATENITNTITTLLKTKTVNDNVVVINYNNYNLKYRSTEGIEYIHAKMNRSKAINVNLPKDSNVVILSGDFQIPKSFIKDLYKHYDFKALSTIRVDYISPDKKFVESDTRIGSTITPKSFNHMAIAFNTGALSKIGETPEETAVIAQKWDVPLVLLPNVRVLLTNTKKRASKGIGVTILIPSLTYRYINDLKSVARVNDKILEFESDARGLVRFVNQKIMESQNECIILINPLSDIRGSDMINRVRGLFDTDKCLLFDTSPDISDDAWLIIPKRKYNYSHKTSGDIKSLQQDILSYNSDSIKYIDRAEVVSNTMADTGVAIPDMFSIIIPFMYNGDRWPLFKASMERLYKCTKDHDNIEIIVHETSPRKYLSHNFIEKHEIVHLYSKYDGLFHRAWNLNVAAKHLAIGGVFVFFDADLLIDKSWVKDLLACDKSRYHFGYGVVTDLTESSTKYFLKTGSVSKPFLRTRWASAHANGGSINVIPRDIFFNIGGWPESYKDKGYGGEDNSLLFKMLSLGYHKDNSQKTPNKGDFKSTIYHMWHGHETKKDDSRFDVFHKHKKYDRNDWLEHIKRNYDWGVPNGNIDTTESKPYINDSLLYVYKNSPEIRITICMVNYLRYDILLRSLANLLSFNIPINLILWVNDSNSMVTTVRKKVESLCSKFAGCDITYSKKNLGTGYPRYMMLNKAYYEFPTDYVMTTDDDIMFGSAESLILGATILDQKDYAGHGAVGLWCDPVYLLLDYDGTRKMVMTRPTPGFYDVNVLGAATMTIRREVLEKCSCDPQFIIGFVDWDFSMSIKSQGWDLCLVCDDRFKPFNDTSGNCEKYQQGRSNEEVKAMSRKLFRDKWKIDIRKGITNRP
jgi:hypothetical protein